jgi:four helix bundle protein
MGKAGYGKLLVWHRADELAYQVYMATRVFPREELYAMTSQLRRAALSVPTSIVEGISDKQEARSLTCHLSRITYHFVKQRV